MISARWATMKASGITIRPPFGSRACAAMTDSSSDLSRTGAAIASTAKDAAAALKGFRKYSEYGAVAGLNRKATRVTRGAISLSSSSHLPAIVGSIRMKPVTLPPGRGKLATKPLPTGSATIAKMMGMVRVCCSSAAVVGVLCRENEFGLQRDEFLRESLHRPRVVGCRPASVDPDVAALRPPELLESLPERRDAGLSFRVALGIGHQHADPPHAIGLLRARASGTPLPRRREA